MSKNLLLLVLAILLGPSGCGPSAEKLESRAAASGRAAALAALRTDALREAVDRLVLEHAVTRCVPDVEGLAKLAVVSCVEKNCSKPRFGYKESRAHCLQCCIAGGADKDYRCIGYKPKDY